MSTHTRPPVNIELIKEALEASLDPSTGNETRLEAWRYLDNVKTQPEAPTYGITLAQDDRSSPSLRHYGLQIMEHAIRYRWNEYGPDETTQIRQWIVNLAGNASRTDATFITNKIAQLWSECAKRSWGPQWPDMDMQLCSLWSIASQDQTATRTLVLYTIETLAEDICNREDAIAGLRSEVLGSFLNDIVVTQSVYADSIDSRNKVKDLEIRSLGEGWLVRICDLLNHCLVMSQNNADDVSLKQSSKISLRAIDTLRAIVTWIGLRTILESGCVETLIKSLHINDQAIQTSSIEVLCSIFSRQSSSQSRSLERELLQQSLEPACLNQLAKFFQYHDVVSSNEESVHALQKKTSELLAAIADGIMSHLELVRCTGTSVFFSILIKAFESSHLVVSIPALHSWSKLLNTRDETLAMHCLEHLGTLMHICSERLLNFEALPEDMNHPVLLHLYMDFDTMPERHAFLGNYRRYCISVIETIARRRPLDAIDFVTSQITSLLESGPYTRNRGLRTVGYNKSALALLQFDAQFTVMMSVLKGVAKWESETRATRNGDSNAGQDETMRAHDILHAWSTRMMSIAVEDPEVATRIFTIISNIVRTIVRDGHLSRQYVNYALSSSLLSSGTDEAYVEAVRSFEGARVIELQKVALVFSDVLLEGYSTLQQQIEKLLQVQDQDTRLRWGLTAFLFIIVQRSSKLDENTRVPQLKSMLDPVLRAWQSEGLQQASRSLNDFCNLLKLHDLPELWSRYRFAQCTDWAAEQLDADGKARQNEIKTSLEHLPLRMTKSMLAATTEKLSEADPVFDTACMLWETIIPAILPTLLNMIKQAQAFNNLANWSHLPPEQQDVLKHTLQDRFWQSGISSETRDEFYARINGSKTSYEGFASSVRGTMRNVREQGYHIIFLLTKFEEAFYGLPELPVHLAKCLFDDADALAANHLQPLISLATGLVQRCPPQHQRAFIPPLLISLFSKLDKKISREWEIILEEAQTSKQEDDLSEEMRGESVLRQLTFSMILFVASLLQQDTTNTPQHNGHKQRSSLADLILMDTAILEPLILFCTHALRMRDIRCCTSICKILLSLVPCFVSDEGAAPQVREFISTEVTKATITSLNEPYFADMQKELAALLAQIIALYSSKTSTPYRLLMSLPDMEDGKVKAAMSSICSTQNARRQRAVILDLLDGVRGVSVHESGKMLQRADLKKQRDRVAGKYIEVEVKPSMKSGDDVGLDGLAGLFGD